MNSARILDRRIMYIVSAAILALVMLIPAIVAAAQVTDRSIELSSSSAQAQNVNYRVNFKAVDPAAAFVLEFCSDSPIVGQTCAAPAGFTVTNATIASGATIADKTVANKLVINRTITAAEAVSVDIAGLKNPDAAGALYARIITYSQANSAQSYNSTALGSNTVDQGGVAISITPTVGVSGAVLESLTFCLSGTTIPANCGSTTAPVLKLGETVASTTALNPGFVSTGNIHTQISTNAATGAVVSLKSNTTCGGLKRVGATACDILPATGTTGIQAGQAKFGVRTAAATNSAGTDTTANGTYQPVAASGYNNTDFRLNYLNTNASGVTSAFGDPFLDTANTTINNKNMALTFGASIANNTPAGLYSADLSLVATGKF